MPKVLKLAPKKQKWVKGRTTTLRGSRLNYNASLQLRYQRALRAITRDMIREVREKVVGLFRTGKADTYFEQQEQAAAMDAGPSLTDKANKLMNSLSKQFSSLFASKADKLAESMLKSTKQYSDTSLQASLRKLSGNATLGVSAVPPGMEDVSQAIINENVGLIKSIPQEYLNDVSGAVMRSITTGNGLYDLEPELKKYSGQTDRRVSLLALDQTRKAYNTINKQRMQGAGVKQFEWLHTGGSQEPRKSHQEISGNIYSFDDLPLKGQEGFTNGQIPGQAINCRCTMIPVIDFDDGEIS